MALRMQAAAVALEVAVKRRVVLAEAEAVIMYIIALMFVVAQVVT
jgi:hypothetical protein